MATVYSLACWKAGAATALTSVVNATDTFTLTAHGLTDGSAILFPNAGEALPAGITAVTTTYYVRVTGVTTPANNFKLYDTLAHALDTASTIGLINITSDGSGARTIQSAFYYGLTDTSRWGARIYDGLYAWKQARQTQSTYEVLEIGEAFADNLTNPQGVFGPADFIGGCSVETRIAGARTAGFHYGNVVRGYVCQNITQGYTSHVVLNGRNVSIDGIRGYVWSMGINAFGINGYGNTVKNCIAKAYDYAYYIGGNNNTIINNLGFDSGTNFFFNGYCYFHVVLNNTSAGGTTGISTNQYGGGVFHNNVAVGASGKDWEAHPTNLQLGEGLTAVFFVEAFNNASRPGGNALFIGNFQSGVAVTGTTITIPIASPAIATWTGHGLTTGAPIKIGGTTVGAGLTKYRMYYAGVIDADTLYIYDTYANAIAAGATGRQNATGASTAIIGIKQGNAITTLTTDCFVNYAAKDFRPVLSPATGSSLVGAAYTGSPITLTTDMLRYDRPGYNNGGAESFSLGCFEYNQGYGNHPATVTISITGMVSGSILAIYKASDMTAIAAPATTSGNYSANYTYTGDTAIIVRVRKGSAAGKYLPYEYTGTITSAGFSLNVSQILDPIA